MSTVYDFKARQIDGRDMALSQFKGKAMLIVNTASFYQVIKRAREAVCKQGCATAVAKL